MHALLSDRPLLRLAAPTGRGVFALVLATILVVLLVFGGSSVRAQTAEDGLRYSSRLPGVGLRLSGMAGTGIAGVGSAGALFTNPAGLGYADRSWIDAGLSSMIAREDVRFEIGPDLSYPGQSRASHTAPSLLHALYKAPTTRGSLVIAGGFHVVQDFTRLLRYGGSNPRSSITENFLPFQDEYSISLETDDQGEYYEITWNDAIPRLAYDGWAINFDETAYEDGEYPFYPTVPGGEVPVRQRDEVVEEGRTSEIVLGGAVEAVEGGMAGFSVTLLTGSYRFDRVFEEVDAQNRVTGEEAPFNFDALSYTETLTTDVVGVNARGGFTFEPGLGFRAGLMLETPTAYSLTDEYRTIVETSFDNGRVESAGRGENAPGSGTFDYSLRTPWRFGGGISYQVADLRLGVDVQYVDWSQMRFDAQQDTEYFDAVNRGIRTEFDPVWPYRVGLEYRLGPVGLRAGYATHPDPRSDVAGPDRFRRFVTGGLTYHFSPSLRFQVGWIREQFDDRFRTYANAPVNPTVSEEVVRDMVTAGFTIGL